MVNITTMIGGAFDIKFNKEPTPEGPEGEHNSRNIRGIADRNEARMAEFETAWIFRTMEYL